ncbi:MAG: nucleoside phosphorylase [Flavobacteriales bacterium]|nr:nucleoside phosphorylase [Flavobacteriales bacterium]
MKVIENISLHQRRSSELILREDGSLYHLGILPEDVADEVIIVGDPDRVEVISQRFDEVEIRKSSREFAFHTGTLNGTRISVLSSGIGVDNIDIVINEIDAAVNCDLQTRIPRSKRRIINFTRIGTCGCMQADVAVGTFVASSFAIGIDGVPWFYGAELEQEENELLQHFLDHVHWPRNLATPYVVKADQTLLNRMSFAQAGITFTANGFYGPQQRELMLPLGFPNMFGELKSITFKNLRLINFEMECAGIYALASMLGHRAVTVCAILANRAVGEFADDPSVHVNRLIDKVLEGLTR